jgi:hypothetical protein
MKAKIIFFLLFLVSFCGCSPEKRLERLIERHPELTARDTIRYRDTIITAGSHADSAFLFTGLTDTVTIRKDNLVMQVFRDTDTLFLSGECLPDTIYRTHEIAVDKIKLVKSDKVDALIRKIPWIVIGLLCIALFRFFLVPHLKV